MTAGAAYGNGIYLAGDISVSAGYSGRASNNNSIIIGCVNLLNSEQYHKGAFSASGIYVVPNEKDVLMVIVTDGQENASKRFSRSMINNFIEDKQKNNNWTYVYLFNDLSTATQGDSIGCMRSAVASNCVVQQENFGDYISSQLNSAIGNYRSQGVSVQSQLNS